MFMALSTDINSALKIAFGSLFVLFILYLAFSTAQGRGLDDTKKDTYKSYKGFLAGGLVMLPVIIILIVFLCISYKGWDGANRVLADGLFGRSH